LLPCCFVSKEDHRIMEQQQTAIGVGGGTNGRGGGGCARENPFLYGYG
jgi:hypothetical protein